MVGLFLRKVEKEEPFFFLIFFAFCRYYADCFSKVLFIRVFFLKFYGFDFQLVETYSLSQVYLLIPPTCLWKVNTKEG